MGNDADTGKTVGYSLSVTIMWPRETRHRMTLDIAHTIVAATLIVSAFVAIEHTKLYRNGSFARRALLLGLPSFAILTLLNLVWPYGDPPWT